MGGRSRCCPQRVTTSTFCAVFVSGAAPPPVAAPGPALLVPQVEKRVPLVSAQQNVRSESKIRIQDARGRMCGFLPPNVRFSAWVLGGLRLVIWLVLGIRRLGSALGPLVPILLPLESAGAADCVSQGRILLGSAGQHLGHMANWGQFLRGAICADAFMLYLLLLLLLSCIAP